VTGIAPAPAVPGFRSGALSWWVQVHRTSLPANAALITPQTLPEVSAAVDEIKQQLGFTRRIEIFVTHGR
jgi:hypothetical protein